MLKISAGSTYLIQIYHSCYCIIGFHTASTCATRTDMHKLYRAGVKLGRTYSESCHRRFFQKVLEVTTCIKKYEGTVGDAFVCEKEPKNASNRCVLSIKCKYAHRNVLFELLIVIFHS